MSTRHSTLLPSTDVLRVVGRILHSRHYSIARHRFLRSRGAGISAGTDDEGPYDENADCIQLLEVFGAFATVLDVVPPDEKHDREDELCRSDATTCACTAKNWDSHTCDSAHTVLHHCHAHTEHATSHDATD